MSKAKRIPFSSHTYLSAMSILCVKQTASEMAMLPLSFTKKFSIFSTSSPSDHERENRLGNSYPTLELICIFGLLHELFFWTMSSVINSISNLLSVSLSLSLELYSPETTGPMSMPKPVVEEVVLPSTYSL